MFKPGKRSNYTSNHHPVHRQQTKHNKKTYKIIRMTRSFATAAVFITSVLTASVLLPAVESRSIPTSSVGKAAGYHHRISRRFRRPSATAAIVESANGGDSSSSEEDLPQAATPYAEHTGGAATETDDDSSEEDLEEKEDNDNDLDDIEALEHLKTRELMRLLHLLESLRGGSLQVHQISGNDAAQLNLLLDKFGL